MNRPLPPSLTALGRRPLPTRIEVEGEWYALQQVYKNDFFAVTSVYQGPTRAVILKLNRQAWFFLIPLRWLGRWLAAREERALRLLADVPGVPRFISRYEGTGVVREYIEGHPLRRGEAVPDDFHPRLAALIDTMHARGMAYVDLEKCENVLVGADGGPWLFDFQISWMWPRSRGGDLWPLSGFRRWLQSGDRYHLRKLQRRTRPDQLSEAELAASYRRPWYVRLHRTLTWPFTWLRRKILDRVAPRRGEGERGRVNPLPRR